jgi:hypothetical protein
MARRRLWHRRIHGDIKQSSGASEIVAIDPSTAQISYAQSRNSAEGVQFQVADARSMPFLITNVSTLRHRHWCSISYRTARKPSPKCAASCAVAELQQPMSGIAGRRGTSQHLHSAVMDLEGPADRPAALNAESTTQESLKALFEAAGLSDVVTRSFEISVTHRDFDDYRDSPEKWNA